MADRNWRSDGEGSSFPNNNINRYPKSVSLSFYDDSSLPVDVLIEMLSLLPVKSLLRFKCVCKSWFTMLNTPAFISLHLTRVPDDQRKMLAMLTEPRMLNNLSHADSRSSKGVYKILSYNTFEEVIPQDLSKCFNKDWKLIGIHNGVACFIDWFNGNIEIWNLATRTRLTVDGCTSTSTRASFSNSREYAFGYDFETDAYKVIRITSLTYRRYGCEVYNVSTDSWSKRDTLIPNGLFFNLQSYFSYDRCCVNGIFSMLIFGGRREIYRNYLLTFDMSNEVSMITPIPGILESTYFAEYRPSYLFPLNNSVALINKCGPSPLEIGLGRPRHLAFRFEIFALNEYGPNGTWIKMYTIGPLYEFSLPLGFRNDGNLLLLRNGKHELVLWDLKANEAKKTVDCGQVHQLIQYKESLVSLK